MTKLNDASPFQHQEAEDSTGFLIWQVTTFWQREIARALKPFKLTHVQFVLLASLLWLTKIKGNKAQVTQIMLARHAKLDVMMCSQVIRSLETKKLLNRSPHASDTRAFSLSLTKAGETLILKTLPLIEGIDQKLFGQDQASQKKLNALLSQLIGQT